MRERGQAQRAVKNNLAYLWHIQTGLCTSLFVYIPILKLNIMIK